MRTYLRGGRAALPMLVAALTAGAVAPAFADEWEHHEHHYYRHQHPPYVYVAPAPPAVIYAPPPVVYAPPPPVVYAPAPVVAPAAGLNLVFPIRIH
jgi:hypothetical protein